MEGILFRERLLRIGISQRSSSAQITFPAHTTVDLSVGKSFGERFSASVNALNVTNSHLLIDNSNTFGGFHYNDPREVYGEVRYHFHY